MATKEDIKTKSGPDKGQGPNQMQPGMMLSLIHI